MKDRKHAKRKNEDYGYMENKSACLNAIEPLGVARYFYHVSEHDSIKSTVARWNKKVGADKGMHLTCRFNVSTSTVIITDDGGSQLTVEKQTNTPPKDKYSSADKSITVTRSFKVFLNGREYEVEDIPLTTKKIAKLLGVTENAVQHMYKRKDRPLPHRKFGRKNVVWLKTFLLWFEPQYGQLPIPSEIIDF